RRQEEREGVTAMFAILLSALAVSADVEPATPREAPRILVAWFEGDQLHSRQVVTVTVPVTVTRKVKQGDNEIAVTETRLVPEMRPVEIAYDLKKATFGTAGGKKLDLDALKKRLAKAQPIVLASDGKPVDEAYLKVLDKDAIVIVLEKPKKMPK